MKKNYFSPQECYGKSKNARIRLFYSNQKKKSVYITPIPYLTVVERRKKDRGLCRGQVKHGFARAFSTDIHSRGSKRMFNILATLKIELPDILERGFVMIKET